MKLSWATDIHLDCVSDPRSALVDIIRGSRDSDAVVLTGDLSLGPTVAMHLRVLEEVLEKPVYFVLGNHDYYYGSIVDTRRRVVEACKFLSFARYLGAMPYVRLDANTALIGSDGWYDGINGEPFKSEIIMNDWLKIADFQSCIVNMPGQKVLDKAKLIEKMRAIAMASVKHIQSGIKAAVRSHDSIIVATHVPPFVESYSSKKYEGSPPEYLHPWYTSRLMGEMLIAAAKTYPHVQFTVLSGHTHSPFDGDILPNLRARVGKSQYGAPQISGYIDI